MFLHVEVRVENGSAAKRSAGVAPEENLRNPFRMQAMKPRVDVTRSPKQGYQCQHERD